MNIIVVVGNPNPGGRTTTVGQTIAEGIARLAEDGGETSTVTIMELAPLGPHLFEWGNDEVAAAIKQVAEADIIIAACPTYKASYTGLLKAFLDNYGNKGLAGCRAVPVMVGASAYHAMAPEVFLRPLLVELGASVPTPGVYVIEDELDSLESQVSDWLAVAGPDLI